MLREAVFEFLGEKEGGDVIGAQDRHGYATSATAKRPPSRGPCPPRAAQMRRAIIGRAK
jgi:hypothetical protein